MKKIYAHSLPSRPHCEWESLSEHLARVGEACASFALVFGWSAVGRVAGLLHDLGKTSAEFQAYIDAVNGAKTKRGPDHSTAGAREAARLFGPEIGRLLAFVIAGHHAGLSDGDVLDERLTKVLHAYDGWESHVGHLPAPSALAPTRRFRPSAEGGFSESFLTRMLFSCLVDADRLETAAFYARHGGAAANSAAGTPLPVLRDRLRNFMASVTAPVRDGAESATQARLRALRKGVLDSAVSKAGLAPDLFTLTVPTGGGKTLTSLSFALEHAVTHGLRRVIYVIPFTSIIEQTAEVFRKALAASPDQPNDGDVLEHHASFDWEAASRKSGTEGEPGSGADPIERLRRATENWDAPIVVTTAVQFFESFFASRPSACRKLHNLADSVIILDEAQTLPLHILRPCLAALEELVRNYGASIVLCTATQPAWRKIDGALSVRVAGGAVTKTFGLDIKADRELAPDPKGLFAALRRVDVEHRREPIDDAVITARFAVQPQILCIVNSRRHAKALFESIKGQPGAIHLSTWMCPRHRRLVLAQARADLKADRPVRIVSTSLIEAGVDIDLPEVWRAAAGLDSLLQAAGRCNREFRHAAGRLVIFEPIDDKGPHELKQAWQAGRAVLRRHDDPQTLEAITAYFRELYFNKGLKAFDASKLEKETWQILDKISERAGTWSFPFASIARAFRVIEESMAPVIVPWSSGSGDEDATRLLDRIKAMDKPMREDLRRLQQYTVSIPERQRDAWLAQGVLKAVHPALGEAMLRFDDLALYDPRSGLRVDEPDRRSPESNVIGA